MVKNKWQVILAGVVLVAVTFGASVPVDAVSKKTTASYKKTVHFVAVGDSLTEGIGDTTKQHGYTDRTAGLIKDRYGITVETANYGKAGDRSDQILTRIKKSKQAVKDIKNADVLTLTVGGNDLQQTLFGAVFAQTTDEVTSGVDKSLPTYEKKLTKLVDHLKSLNKDAPIFLFGNYNPLYVYLANREDLNDDVKRYNQVNADLAGADKRVYYVSTFNTLTYGQYNTAAKRAALVKEAEAANKGSLNNQEVKATLNGDDKEKNDLITNLDHYHPNDNGYDRMSQLLFNRMTKFTKDWLVK
jgi:lysophospholipase L1-like esterase